MQSEAAHALEYLSQQELVIDGLCESIANPAPYLGGLGQEKTKEIAEERASNGKCGNITCKNTLSAPYPTCSEHSVAILNNKEREVVRGRDLEQFCSQACFLAFRDLVKTRPMGDVWTMQKLALKSTQAVLPGVKPRTSIVRGIKEKETKKTGKKSVTFAPSVVASTTVVPRYEKEGEEEEEEWEEDEEEEEESDGDEDIMSWVERVDFSQVELTLHGGVSSHLTSLTTQASKTYFAQPVGETQPAVDVSKINPQVLQGILFGLGRMEPEIGPFKLAAAEELTRLLSKFDTWRPLPRDTENHWILLTTVLLAALAESRRVDAFFNRDDLLLTSAFARNSPDLLDIDAARFAMLKWMVRNL